MAAIKCVIWHVTCINKKHNYNSYMAGSTAKKANIFKAINADFGTN